LADDAAATPPSDPPSDDALPTPGDEGDGSLGRMIDTPIEDELKTSYLTYAMSVIVSRALPDARDGLKPSQRRILVAMNDLNLGPGASRVKCAKISGDTSGNYHPHGESVIYPTLVRMAQEWQMRTTLVDKQGNFGSIAGLPPAAMRYTEARLAAPAAAMLDDLKLDTVDYIPTYDERSTEPTVLPSRFPNLLVNGAQGIAVGMATSIPPHNLGEVCRAITAVIENPGVSIDEIMEILPGPDFPTGGVICGRAGIRRGYHTGRGAVVVRSNCTIEETKKGGQRIIVHDIPYQQTRDRVYVRMSELANDGKVKGIREIRDESDLEEPVRLVVELKKDADPDIVLNQLYQFSPMQDSFSIILLALVDGKPRVLSIKGMIEEYIRHRAQVIRRRTQHLLLKARQRKHTVEGLLLALANIDEVIRIIRSSSTQAEAKQRLTEISTPASMLARALGEEGFAQFQEERGVADEYRLTPVQSDAILRMTLGSLVNLEQERLSDEHRKLLGDIKEFLRILGDEQNILAIIKDDLATMERRFGDARRTQITGEEVGNIDLEDLIEEETMVVSISHSGYIKRTAASTYRAQRRGGKGLKGARTEDEDPIEHLFVASTHDYLMFFTNKGRVYWQKVYDLPNLSRESRGRAIANVLQMEPEERIADCFQIRDFERPGDYLLMATKNGLVKKTPLKAYGNVMKRGIIAIKLRDGDELVDVALVRDGDEVMLATAGGLAIRFRQDDARAMGRNASGVKGISLVKGDSLVGMVVVNPEGQLLTVCQNGYGKRTPFGPNYSEAEEEGAEQGGAVADASTPPQGEGPGAPEELTDDSAHGDENGDSDENETSSGARYRTQRRGGKGLRDIKTTRRNGPVIGILSVTDEDDVLMMTARGKIQRIACNEISVIGRNTQGVRIMSLDEDDTLVAVKLVPREENGDDDEPEPATP